MFETLKAVSEDDFQTVVQIDGIDHRVDQALHRTVCHAAYHVGLRNTLSMIPFFLFASAQWWLIGAVISSVLKKLQVKRLKRSSM